MEKEDNNVIFAYFKVRYRVIRGKVFDYSGKTYTILLLSLLIILSLLLLSSNIY